MDSRLYLYLLALFILLISGCNPGRHLSETQYLVNKSNIEVEDADVRERELQNYIRQEPNNRIFWLYPFQLHVYQFAERRSENRLTNWLKNSVGEPPVIYDQTLTETTAQQFKLYLQQKGYFNASVDYDVDFKESQRKANITYNLKGGTPYRVRNIDYSIPDERVAEHIYNDTINSLLNRNETYDADLLQEERNRISRNLRNKGFYRFVRDYIHFEIDSTLNEHKL